MNADTITTAINDSLRESAMLASLTMSCWIPERTDRSLSGDVADARHGHTGAFAVRKKLLAGADAHFKAIHKLQGQFREWFEHNTLPFSAGSGQRRRGPRILSTALYMDMTTKLVEIESEQRKLLDEAKARYAESIEVARRNLGSAFNESDYPDPDRLDALFDIDVDVMPIPTGSSFSGLPADTREVLGDWFESRVADKAGGAADEMIDRVMQIARRIVDRIEAHNASLEAIDRGEDVRRAPLHAGMFEAAGAVADMIEAYGSVCSADSRLDNARYTLRELAQFDVKDARESAFTRTEIASTARGIVDCFE